MRVIRGESGAGKTALVFREFKQALHAGAEVRIIVPTATLVRHFQHELARDGEVFAPHAVTTLSAFAQRAAEPLRPAPPGVLRALIRESLKQEPEFSALAEADGMVATLEETIALFENAGATPERLNAVKRLRGHGKAFARLWTAVAARLRSLGFATRPEIFRAAAASAAAMKIWLDGFFIFSPLETELIRALGRSSQVSITVSGDELWRQTLEWGCEDRLLTAAARRPEITAVTAPSLAREADEVARRIAGLRARGVPYGEIAVGIRDTDAYESLLQTTFERFGIPAHFYFGRPLRHSPAARFLNGLIRCELGGWEFGAALEALRNHPHWGAASAFDRYDFRVREAMPGHGAQALLALCENEWLHKRLAECLAVAGWALDKLTPRQWSERFRSFAEHIWLPGLLNTPRSFAEIENLRAQSSALSAWVQAADQAATFWPENAAPVSLPDFQRVANECIDAADFRIPDSRHDVVHVMNVFELRQWDVQSLFLCGLTDRDFPKKALPNLLFPDAEIEALRRAGLPLRKASDSERDEEALFRTLRGRARETLVLSCPSHDAGGRRVASSRFVVQLLDDGRARTREARLCRPEIAVPPLPGLVGRIDSADLLASLAERHATISVSHLEDLAQCRFRFFAGKTLNLKTRPERPQERLQARMTGLILHRALENWLAEGRTRDFVGYFEKAFDDTCREEHLLEGYRLELERIEARRIARQVQATEKWTAVSHEVEVPVSIAFPGGVAISGRIDRVDKLNETDCIVVDYKSGKTKNVEKFAQSPLKLQGPLYALALREGRGLNTIAMMFHAVRDDKRFGWGEIPGADIELQPIPERWMEDARDRTLERLTGYLAGAVRAEPADRGYCRWCDFSAACRYEEREALVMIEGAG